MIIQSILPIDACRHTSNLCVAARAAATGVLFKPEEIFRLLVWHTPVFQTYAQVMTVLRQALQRCEATQLQVQAVMPKLFLLTLHRRSTSDPSSLVGGVLLEVHAKGQILAAEVLGTVPGPLTARYEVYSSSEPVDLERLEHSWPSRPMKLSDLTREPPRPRENSDQRATRVAEPQKTRSCEPRKLFAEPKPKNPQVPGVRQQPLTPPRKPNHSTAEIKRPSRRQRQAAQREAQQLVVQVNAEAQQPVAGELLA